MKKIDLSKIQELENENDAYWMDREGNIGILEFVGECDGSHYVGQRSRLYKKNGNLEYIVTSEGEGFEKVFLFGNEDKTNKSNHLMFKMLDPYDNYFRRPYVFVPNKKTLLDLFNKLNNEYKKYYIVDDSLVIEKKYFTKERLLKLKRQKNNIFESKEMTLEYFNTLKENAYKELISLKSKTDKIKKIAESRVNVNLPIINTMYIKAKDAKSGEKYHFKHLDGKGYTKKTVTIDYVDKDGVVHLTNGKVLSPNAIILSDESYKNLEKIKNNNELTRTLYTINEFLKKIDKGLNRINSIVNPFENKANVFWTDLKSTFDRLCKYIEQDEEFLEN